MKKFTFYAFVVSIIRQKVEILSRLLSVRQVERLFCLSLALLLWGAIFSFPAHAQERILHSITPG